MDLEKNDLGYQITSGNFTLFFGGTHSQLPHLKEHYPHIDFARVKQSHSDIVVETQTSTSDYQINADAHFSKKAGLGLCIITADCVPALFFDPISGLIAAVHAGWRGVASQIIPKTLIKLCEQGAVPQNIRAVIGPHIQQESFEVENSVRDQILKSLGDLRSEEAELYYETTSPEKSRVDLNAIVRRQLQLHEIGHENLFNLHIDTFKNLEFHSYRRDKESSGRQISFVCKNAYK